MNDRSLHSNLAERTKFFSPSAVPDDPDDPRAYVSAQDSARFAVSLAVALGGGDIVPDEPHALSRCGDTAVVLSTIASDGPLHGILRCNRRSEHS